MEQTKDTPTPETTAEAQPTTEQPISQDEIARAFTNSPALSPDEFMLGDRKFKVVDLQYNDYVVFLLKLKPLLKGMTLASTAGKLALPDLGEVKNALTADAILEYLLEDLPQMAQLVCKGTDPDITIEQVKKLAGNPFKLAEVVLKQVVRNNMIGAFADFFAQLRPMLSPRLSGKF